MGFLRNILRDLADIQQGVAEVRQGIQAQKVEGPAPSDLEGPLGDVDRILGTGEAVAAKVTPGLSRAVLAGERLSGRLRRTR